MCWVETIPYNIIGNHRKSFWYANNPFVKGKKIHRQNVRIGSFFCILPNIWNSSHDSYVSWIICALRTRVQMKLRIMLCCSFYWIQMFSTANTNFQHYEFTAKLNEKGVSSASETECAKIENAAQKKRPLKNAIEKKLIRSSLPLAYGDL